jgi:putative ATP-dependent endonuclease of OLD family
MRISNLTLKNFRLLSDVTINLEDDITLIVGKNNTGKTSLLEAIKIFASGEDKLSFEDFSQSTYPIFKDVLRKFQESLSSSISEERKEELEKYVQDNIPRIELIIQFEYDKKTDSLIELSEFISDLDVNRNDATALISYEPTNSLGMLSAFVNRSDEKLTLLQYLKENLNVYYWPKCYALDPHSEYLREIEGSFKDKIKKIVSFEDIKALRVLDDKKGDKNKTLASGFSRYYNERDKTDQNVKDLESVLIDVSTELKGKYDIVLKKILEDLKRFGAATPINIPAITIKSEFNSESVIKDNIKYYYQHDEIDLPESYNGLGYSNLIYMVLELASFIERLRNSKDEKVSEFLMVLIEEPEAHMHPQMQQVFISQIKGILEEAQEDGFYVQLVITSHSSHILSEAGIDSQKGFNRIRYFNRVREKIEVQDFNALHIEDEKHTFRFLKQYLTLHKSDLFFADKVIIVEGTTERMLLPQMIMKVAPSLCTEYLSILEVGGAYTHKFKEILNFIGVKTLVITDLDSCDQTTHEKCPVNNGNNNEVTSNETLKSWIPAKGSIKELIAVTENDKIEAEIRVAFQIAQNSDIGRSFEEAFILANRTFLESSDKVKNQFSFLRARKLVDIKSETAYNLAPKGSSTKTNFAFDAMSFNEELGLWEVPAYIKEGLEWLAGMCVNPLIQTEE